MEIMGRRGGGSIAVQARYPEWGPRTTRSRIPAEQTSLCSTRQGDCPRGAGRSELAPSGLRDPGGANERISSDPPQPQGCSVPCVRWCHQTGRYAGVVTNPALSGMRRWVATQHLSVVAGG